MKKLEKNNSAVRLLNNPQYLKNCYHDDEVYLLSRVKTGELGFILGMELQSLLLELNINP